MNLYTVTWLLDQESRIGTTARGTRAALTNLKAFKYQLPIRM
jgi:hypothetical protein